MTHAVLMVLIFFAILFVFHSIFLVVLWCSNSGAHSKPKQDSLLNLNEKRDNEEYLIVYASQSGQTENYARQTVQQLSSLGHTAQAISVEYFDTAVFSKSLKILWMVSTYGEGDAPDTARQFIQNVMTKSFDLNDIQCAVLAFGDRRYQNFCAFGMQLDIWLKDNQAQILFPIVRVDQLNQADLAEWQSQLGRVLDTSLSDHVLIDQQPFSEVILAERYLLNKGSLGHPMYHLLLKKIDVLSWQSGDILEIQCANSDSQISAFLNDTTPQLTGNLLQVDIFEQLRFKNLRTYPSKIINEQPSFSFEQWITQSENLPIREYSIASIPSQKVLELVVRQEITGNGLGLGSGYLTENLALGEVLHCRIRSNPAFHLIEYNAPIILIGNGSGIAGLMSHIQQRAEHHFHQNWLIYGERQKAVDVGFAQQILDWQNQGILTDVDFAFSRDPYSGKQNSFKYVQDCLRAKAEHVNAWVDRGAMIYICGSLKGMAQDVESTLIEVLGQEGFDQLLEKKRYLRDVY